MAKTQHEEQVLFEQAVIPKTALTDDYRRKLGHVQQKLLRAVSRVLQKRGGFTSLDFEHDVEPGTKHNEIHTVKATLKRRRRR